MRRKAQTVICPHCGEDFDVKENGRYICPECENYVDVNDWFDTKGERVVPGHADYFYVHEVGCPEDVFISGERTDVIPVDE